MVFFLGNGIFPSQILPFEVWWKKEMKLFENFEIEVLCQSVEKTFQTNKKNQVKLMTNCQSYINCKKELLLYLHP